jgi:hypothetical protein
MADTAPASSCLYSSRTRPAPAGHQAICPPHLLGRMNAAIRWVVWGTIPLGGLLGGVFGTVFGVRATLWIAFTGSWAAGWWVFFSPLRAMRDIPWKTSR